MGARSKVEDDQQNPDVEVKRLTVVCETAVVFRPQTVVGRTGKKRRPGRAIIAVDRFIRPIEMPNTWYRTHYRPWSGGYAVDWALLGLAVCGSCSSERKVCRD